MVQAQILILKFDLFLEIQWVIAKWYNDSSILNRTMALILAIVLLINETLLKNRRY